MQKKNIGKQKLMALSEGSITVVRKAVKHSTVQIGSKSLDRGIGVIDSSQLSFGTNGKISQTAIAAQNDRVAEGHAFVLAGVRGLELWGCASLKMS